MAKRRAQIPDPGDREDGQEHLDSEEQYVEETEAVEINRLSTLQLFDFLIFRFFEAGVDEPTLRMLRDRIEEMEEMQDQARSAVEQLSAAVDKLKAPALRLGTLLQRMSEDRVLVCVGGTDYLCSVNPSLPPAVMETGMRMLLNEAFAVIDSFGYDKGGPIVRISEVLPDGRLRVGSEHGLSDAVVLRSSLLSKEKLKPGLDVRLDPNQRVVTELFAQSKRIDRSLSTVTEVTWEDVGGQWEAIEAIRDTIEMPYLHAHLFERFDHPVPKGFLLSGPPGCGKTLMGKATAHNLRLQIREKTQEDHPEFFLHVKGPEILNMWLGESERQVRDLFAQCREKSADGELAFLFIDEAESILGTRGAHRGGGNILSTLVPMFCAEMDGIEPLDNVVVILASNRADLIDPAILRPGRVDRKIRVRRPDRDAAREIYRIYLTADLPLGEPRDEMIEDVLEAHYAEIESNRFLEITYRSGRHEFLHRGALASGALIAAVIERSKELAIKRSVKDGVESPMRTSDLLEALDREHRENELFPPTEYTEDWLKLTDFDPTNVINLKPYRPKRGGGSATSI